MPADPAQQSVVMLDLEGVLVPEVWIAIAEKTGIAELRRTTRDEPDYDKLMRGRLAILDERGVKMSDIVDVLATISPIEGARDFLDALRTHTQVLIISDTFEQFGRPLMAQLNWPTLICHRLEVTDDRITSYRLRMADQKRHCVRAFHGLNYRVAAAGDSYNDIAMLTEADAGFLFHAPANVIAEFPQLPSLTTYDELLDRLLGAIT